MMRGVSNNLNKILKTKLLYTTNSAVKAVQDVACEHTAAATSENCSLASGSDPYDVASVTLGDDGRAAAGITWRYVV